MRHVIIGNGIAGVEAIGAIRSLDQAASVTLIAREPHPPYCRPMISLLLAGEVAESALPIRDAGFYERMGVEALLGREAVRISVAARTVVLDDGEEVGFDRLLVASGSDPRLIEAANLELPGVFFFRTWDHARELVRACAGARRALVAGGGLVGFKAAHGLLQRGIPVTLLIRSGYPLSMQVDAAAGALILEQLLLHGLEVRTGLEVRAFEARSGRLAAAVLDDGSSLECDVAVIGKGVVPAMEFLPPEIETHAGVHVDDHLQTTVPGIYAAGDVVEAHDVARRKRWVNAIWPVAVEQGRVAGWNMAGRDVPYRGGLGRNVIRIFDLDVMTAGIVTPPAQEAAAYQVHVRESPRKRTYRKLVVGDDGTAVGMALVNDVEQGGVMMNLIQQGRVVNEQQIESFLEGTFGVARVA